MRVLLTNITLASRSGTEVNVRDLALGLLRRGHRPVVYSPELGEIAAEIRAATVAVVDDLAAIAAPQSLYDPPFGLEAIDFEVMHAELLGYTELVNRIQTMSQTEIAGSVPVDRQRRDAGTPTCPNEN